MTLLETMTTKMTMTSPCSTLRQLLGPALLLLRHCQQRTSLMSATATTQSVTVTGLEAARATATTTSATTRSTTAIEALLYQARVPAAQRAGTVTGTAAATTTVTTTVARAAKEVVTGTRVAAAADVAVMRKARVLLQRLLEPAGGDCMAEHTSLPLQRKLGKTHSRSWVIPLAGC
jgi:carbon monoxide dehydrogenase subunit G